MACRCHVLLAREIPGLGLSWSSRPSAVGMRVTFGGSCDSYGHRAGFQLDGYVARLTYYIRTSLKFAIFARTLQLHNHVIGLCVAFSPQGSGHTNGIRGLKGWSEIILCNR